MIDSIFTSLPDSYIDNVIDQPLVFYFSLGDTKKTVRLTI